MPQSLVGCPEVRLNGRNSAAPSFFMSYNSAQLLSIEHPSCISLPSFTYHHLLKESSGQVSSSRVRLIFLHVQKYLQGSEEVISFSVSTSIFVHLILPYSLQKNCLNLVLNTVYTQIEPYFTCKVLIDPCANKTELFNSKSKLHLMICAIG